jgi:2-polyprenyl-3-methyl-5-hydroxy-6-metoxy-1,4-benzoquinol methylase
LLVLLGRQLFAISSPRSVCEGLAMVVAIEPRAKSRADSEAGIAWEKVPCLLCQDERAESIVHAADNDPSGGALRFGVARCQRCGLCYTNPRPTANSIAQFYTDDYPPHQIAKNRRVQASTMGRWLARLAGQSCRERHYLPFVGQGRLLDFGCGGGDFLLRMRDQGWQATGLDSSSKVIRFLRKVHGLHGYVGSLPHPDLPPASFDVVTMWAALEHVHQPLAVLREAYRLLSPGGRLYVQVPNFESWDRRLFGAHWYSLDLPRHLTHFGPATLALALRSAGFRLLELRQLSHPSSTRKSLRIAVKSGGAGVGARVLSAKPVRLAWSWLALMLRGGDHLFAMAERV